MTVINAVWLLVVNIAAWLVLHFSISVLCFKIPLRFFLKDSVFFRIAKWEQRRGNLESSVFSEEMEKALNRWVIDCKEKLQ